MKNAIHKNWKSCEFTDRCVNLSSEVFTKREFLIFCGHVDARMGIFNSLLTTPWKNIESYRRKSVNLSLPKIKGVLHPHNPTN